MLTVIFRHLLADRAVDDDILYKLVQVNDHRRSALLAHRTAITGQVDQRQALACLDLPLAYIGGTADRLVPCGDHAQQIAQLRPDTAVTLIDGAPHMLLQVRSQQCAREIRKLARSARLLNSDLA